MKEEGREENKVEEQEEVVISADEGDVLEPLFEHSKVQLRIPLRDPNYFIPKRAEKG